MLAAGKGGTATGRAAEAQEHFDILRSVGVDLPDVFLVLENEGVDKFQTKLDATAGMQHRCRAGEFCWDGR